MESIGNKFMFIRFWQQKNDESDGTRDSSIEKRVRSRIKGIVRSSFLNQCWMLSHIRKEKSAWPREGTHSFHRHFLTLFLISYQNFVLDWNECDSHDVEVRILSASLEMCLIAWQLELKGIKWWERLSSWNTVDVLHIKVEFLLPNQFKISDEAWIINWDIHTNDWDIDC